MGQRQEKQFDILIDNATILTALRDAPLIENAVIGVRDGNIALLETHHGNSREKGDDGAWSAKHRIDAADHLVIPGLINVHTHTILTMVRGVAEDMGFAPAYTPGVPHGHEVTPDEAVALARLGALECLLFGSTLINDSYVHADLTMPAMAEVGLRTYTCGRIHDVDFSRVHEKIWEHKDEIGEKTLGDAIALAQKWHGKENGRMGVSLAAHAPDTCSKELLHRVRQASDDLGIRVHTHLAQSEIEVQRIAERDGMTPAELLDDVGLLNNKLLCAHCLFLNEDDISRVGRAAMNVAHIPKGNATGGTSAPTGALRKAGANITLATDNMHGDMVEVMRWGLNIGRLQEGCVNDFWQPQDVFEMATINGARAMGLEDDIGSIELGKKADLVIVDLRQPHFVPRTNVLGNLLHVAQGRDVSIVIVDGDIVVEDGKPTRVDMASVMADAEQAAQALWQRARAQVA